MEYKANMIGNMMINNWMECGTRFQTNPEIKHDLLVKIRVFEYTVLEKTSTNETTI